MIISFLNRFIKEEFKNTAHYMSEEGTNNWNYKSFLRNQIAVAERESLNFFF